MAADKSDRLYVNCGLCIPPSGLATNSWVVIYRCITHSCIVYLLQHLNRTTVYILFCAGRHITCQLVCLVQESFLFFSQIRFVSADDIWLSLNYQQDSCHLTVIIYDPSQQLKEGYFSSLHQSLHMAGLQPRIHLGKYADLRNTPNIYPKYSDFKKIRKQMDPHKLFVNKMLADYF